MSGTPELATERLLLRPLAVADADEMVGVLGDSSLYEFTGGDAPTLGELRRRYERQVVGQSDDESEDWHNWIVRRRDDLAAVGYVQATIDVAAGTAEVAWVIGTAFQRSGFAVEAAAVMVDWLLGEPDLASVSASIHPDHVGSNRVARRIGLVPTDHYDADGERSWLLEA